MCLPSPTKKLISAISLQIFPLKVKNSSTQWTLPSFEQRGTEKFQFSVPLIPVLFADTFHPFCRPRRPLGRVEVQLYSVFRPRHQNGVRGQRHTPVAFYPRERSGNHCTGGWVGPRAGLDDGNFRPTGIRSPNRPARSHSLYRQLLGPHPLRIDHKSVRI